MKVQNRNPFPVDVPGGGVLALAQVTDVKDSRELDAAIAAGKLTALPKPKKDTK